jgi:transposase
MAGLSSPAPRPLRAPAGSCECRCSCGSLLARLVEDGVELKCRRCKRTVVVPLAGVSPGRARRLPAIPLGETG